MRRADRRRSGGTPVRQGDAWGRERHHAVALLALERGRRVVQPARSRAGIITVHAGASSYP